MVYIWAVEALGKGPSELKTKKVFVFFMSVVKIVEYKLVIQNQSDDVDENEEENGSLLLQKTAVCIARVGNIQVRLV